MELLEFIFALLVIAWILTIESRPGKLLKIQRELLSDVKQCESHLRTMREAYEEQTK
jgi:hypothetical protein